MKPSECGHRFVESSGCRVVPIIGNSGHPGFQLPELSVVFDQAAAGTGGERNGHGHAVCDVLQQPMQSFDPLSGQPGVGPAAESQWSSSSLDPHDVGLAEARLGRQFGRSFGAARVAPGLEEFREIGGFGAEHFALSHPDRAAC